jgi:hypothetical protein
MSKKRRWNIPKLFILHDKTQQYCADGSIASTSGIGSHCSPGNTARNSCNSTGGITTGWIVCNSNGSSPNDCRTGFAAAGQICLVGNSPEPNCRQGNGATYT